MSELVPHVCENHGPSFQHHCCFNLMKCLKNKEAASGRAELYSASKFQLHFAFKTFTPFLSISHSLSPSLSLSLSLSHIYTHTHARTANLILFAFNRLTSIHVNALSLSLSPSHSPFHSIPLVSSLSVSLSLSLSHTLPQSTKNKENAKCGLVFEFLDVKFPFFQIIKIARHEKVFSSKEKKSRRGKILAGSRSRKDGMTCD